MYNKDSLLLIGLFTVLGFGLSFLYACSLNAFPQFFKDVNLWLYAFIGAVIGAVIGVVINLIKIYIQKKRA